MKSLDVANFLTLEIWLKWAGCKPCGRDARRPLHAMLPCARLSREQHLQHLQHCCILWIPLRDFASVAMKNGSAIGARVR